MSRSEREPQQSGNLITALQDAKRRLELVDEIENPMERAFKRELLLELQDSLQAEINDYTSKKE